MFPAVPNPDQEALPRANELARLLNLLRVPAAPTMPLFSEQGRTRGLQRSFRQSQEIARDTRNWDEIAHAELQMGLHNYQWGDFDGAVAHFREAQGRSRLASHEHTVFFSLLAQFGEGCACHQLYDYEKALGLYRQTRSQLERQQRLLQPRDYSPEHDLRRRFLEALRLLLNAATEALDHTMQQRVTAAIAEPPPPRAPGYITLRADAAAPPPPPAGSPPVADQTTPPQPLNVQPQINPALQPPPGRPRVNIGAAPPPAGAANRTIYTTETATFTPFTAPPINQAETEPGDQVTRPGPSPTHIQLSQDHTLYYVRPTNKQRRYFLTDLRRDDWLIVNLAKPAYNTGDYVVLGQQVKFKGDIKVSSDSQPPHRPEPSLYAVRLLKILPNKQAVAWVSDDLPRLRLDLSGAAGEIIGFFRYLVPAGSTSPPAMSHVSSDCARIPTPQYFTPAGNRLLYCVEHKAMLRFLPDVRQGDWLIVEPGQQRFNTNATIVLGGGGDEVYQDFIRVRPNQPGALPAPPHFLGQFVRSTDTGEIEFRVNERDQFRLPADLLVGTVIGFFRYLASEPAPMINSGSPGDPAGITPRTNNG